MRYMLYILLFFISSEAFSQNNVGIGTNTPAPDAILELKSTNQGILIPRLSTTQRLAINNPTNGLMVFDTNYNCFYFYVSTAAAWRSVCPGPVGPVVNSNVQVYSSQGVCTDITDTNMVTVNGLSLAITLIDTATVILSSNGSMVAGDSTYASATIQTVVQLYQNALPLTGTKQTNDGFNLGNASTVPYGFSYTHWGVSTVLLLTPGTYLFELKAGRIYLTSNVLQSIRYYAACNYYHNNQGIITAEVIYK